MKVIIVALILSGVMLLAWAGGAPSKKRFFEIGYIGLSKNGIQYAGLYDTSGVECIIGDEIKEILVHRYHFEAVQIVSISILSDQDRLKFYHSELILKEKSHP